MSATGKEWQSSARTSKPKQFLDPQVMDDLVNNVVEVRAEAFIRAFLYPSSRLGEQEPLMERDLKLAGACHDMLKQEVSKHDALTAILTDPTCPKYSKAGFTLLHPDVKNEDDLYTPFRTLFTFINLFYRISLANRPLPHDIDAAWPAAVDPKPGDLRDTMTLTEPVRRDFFDTRKSNLNFSPRLAREPANFKPDLVLMAHRDKDPSTKLRSVHWKDVRVPIEIKKNFKSEGKTVSQLALYVHAMFMEQFDRKFALTVSLTATQCRLFHWDSVGCHVTEPLDIHDDPILFIRCIARLAMMTPVELGYDEHFSNAGRVLSDQEITTTLLVRASPIREYLDEEPKFEEMPPERAAPVVLEFDIEKPLYESRAVIFHEYTRVWRGKEILDLKIWETGPTRVVKQTWAEDTQPSEGFFCKLTNNIPTFCPLVLMEECDSTWAYHNRVAEKDVIRYLKATETKSDQQPPRAVDGQAEEALPHSEPNSSHAMNTVGECPGTPSNERPEQDESLERVLLRLVFKEEYRPLSKAISPLELLNATVQWIEGLIALDRLGIVHRNISYSNLMLPVSEQGSGSPVTAKIIDLGLAHRKDLRKGSGPLSCPPVATSGVPETPIDGQSSLPGNSSPPTVRAPRHYHKIIGTTPFIALKLLRQFQFSSNTELIEHALHHDVESVFWVLVYISFLKAQDSGMVAVTEMLGLLLSPEIFIVATVKSATLHDPWSLSAFVGPLDEMRGFLEAFARYYHGCHRDDRPIDALKVLEIAIEHRDKLSKKGNENPASTGQ